MKPVSNQLIAQNQPSSVKTRKAAPIKNNAVETTKATLSQMDESDIGVTIRMKTRLMGLQQAEANISDTTTLLQVANGHLLTAERLLQKVRTLAVRSSNGIYTNNDRQLFQVQVSQLVDEVDRIASQAEFNDMALLQGEFARDSRVASMWVHMGPNMHQRERIYLGTITALSLRMRNIDGSTISISTAGLANETIGQVDSALQRIGKERSDIKGYLDRLKEASQDIIDELKIFQKSKLFGPKPAGEKNASHEH